MIRDITLAEQVYDYLATKISTGEFLPGHTLRELDLVGQLGVSRTPIREALFRLSEYGLVSLNSRSAKVRLLTREEVEHIFQVRIALELAAIELACRQFTEEDFASLDELTPPDLTNVDEPASARLDRELHLRIALRSGNPILQREIRKLIDLIRLAHKKLAHDQAWLEREVQEHLAIIEALRSRNPKKCRQALAKHLQSAMNTNLYCAGE